jgi:hypothetical protein
VVCALVVSLITDIGGFGDVITIGSLQLYVVQWHPCREQTNVYTQRIIYLHFVTLCSL